MDKHIEYKTRGVCARQVTVDIKDGYIAECKFLGGCSGNTQGVAALVVGLTPEEAVRRLKGIKCGFKQTSCPDQLALALEEALAMI